MILYESGGMRGYPENNREAFDRAATIWRALGYKVISPSELDAVRRAASGDGGVRYEDVIVEDVGIITKMADGLLMLPHWERSKGCLVEVATALGHNVPKPLICSETGREIIVEWPPVLHWTLGTEGRL